MSGRKRGKARKHAQNRSPNQPTTSAMALVSVVMFTASFVLGTARNMEPIVELVQFRHRIAYWLAIINLPKESRNSIKAGQGGGLTHLGPPSWLPALFCKQACFPPSLVAVVSSRVLLSANNSSWEVFLKTSSLKEKGYLNKFAREMELKHVFLTVINAF